MSFGMPDYSRLKDVMYLPNKEQVVIETVGRPCIVNGEQALFHRWSDISRIVPPSLLVGGHGGGVVQGTYAIVEMKDGTVRLVDPEEVCFTDNAALFERHCMGKFEEGKA